MRNSLMLVGIVGLVVGVAATALLFLTWPPSPAPREAPVPLSSVIGD